MATYHTKKAKSAHNTKKVKLKPKRPKPKK